MEHHDTEYSVINANVAIYEALFVSQAITHSTGIVMVQFS